MLFVCVHNSARSQMAEAFLNAIAGDRFEAQSAGLEPGALNPVVVEAMKEAGIDISGSRTKSVDEFLKKGEAFDYVFTVCDAAAGERCPVFPGTIKNRHAAFDDPGSFSGSFEEKLDKTRVVRDKIKYFIEEFIKDMELPRTC